MKNNKTTKRVDLPVDEFINQFPLTAQLEIDYFFKENRSIRKSVPTVLDFLLDAFEGYEEEKEIKKLLKLYDKEKWVARLLTVNKFTYENADAGIIRWVEQYLL